jgi:homoserine dehydrogenase
MKAAVLGYGTIGSGVVEILEQKKELITRETGEEVSVKYVLDLRDFPGDPVEKILVHDFDTILNDPEVGLVVETMGGTGAAYTFVKSALLAGKSACTSNKALVAKYGSELLAIAREKKLNFQFEASVGGGIPIIRPLYSCMTAGNITEITGILNGTTNFMLSKMDLEGRAYEDVLKEAQALGYAERDPSADVEGYDACRKIAILSSIAFGKFVDFEQIETRGITDITKDDMAFARKMGYAIKLLGSCKNVDGKIYASVSPKFLPTGHPLYPVSGVFNAVYVKGDMSGDLMFYGSGAGKLPTASAVVADVVEITRNPGRTVFAGWADETLALSENTGAENQYFVRFNAADQSVEEAAAAAFGAEEITKIDHEPGFALLTAKMTRAEYEEKAAAFSQIAQMIPVQG